uniref:FecR family protein n=1 Tax=Pedobacter schmidteae TaxID=2201271 RepID=UPI000EB0093D|nr:FecR family protein [Pedobacter schmidteae]
MDPNGNRKSTARLKELMVLYFEQDIEDREKQELWGYVNDPMFAYEVKSLIPDATEHPLSSYLLEEEKQNKILGFIFKEAGQETRETDHVLPLKTISRRVGWRQLSIAASIVVVLSCLTFAFFKNRFPAANHKDLVARDVPAGHNGATLTLADGKTIHLQEVSNGEIARQAGVKIEKGSDGELIYHMDSKTAKENQVNTLATSNGQMYSISLPDGSRVWLNAASELKYMTSLIEDGRRVVNLKGEAYFEISRDHRHPFIVRSGGQEVEVLGTHFNINAYENEPYIATTLLEGSIRLNTSARQEILKPGQQAQNTSGNLQIKLTNTDNVTDWKEGDFSFKNVDFRTALRKIERWYNVEMIYDKSLPKDLQAGGWISRKKNLSSVLDFIESVNMVRFKVEGRKVYVTPY